MFIIMLIILDAGYMGALLSLQLFCKLKTSKKISSLKKKKLCLSVLMVFLGKFNKLIHIQYLVPDKYEYANKCCLFLKRGCLVKGSKGKSFGRKGNSFFFFWKSTRSIQKTSDQNETHFLCTKICITKVSQGCAF